MAYGWLTLGQVARAMGVSRRTVYQYCVDGKLPAIRTPGNHFRVQESEVLYLVRKLERLDNSEGGE